jgi:hypothetical protein
MAPRNIWATLGLALARCHLANQRRKRGSPPVEDPAGDPLGDRGQREDVAHLAQVDAAGDRDPGPDRPDQLGDDVRAHRRVERVGVIGDGVGRVELVAVLAVDDLLGL